MSQRPIVVVGSVHMDLIARAERLPRVGETLAGHYFATRPGGKGVNQALAAARLGAQVSFVGCVGADHFGREMSRALERGGVDIRHLRTVAAEPTGVGCVLMDAGGEYLTVMVGGADLRLSAEDVVRASTPCFPQGCIALLQWEIAPAPTALAARVAHERGGTVIWNAAPAPASLPAELASYVDILVASSGEARQLTGLDEDEAAALRLAERVPTVVVTRGAGGALVVDATKAVTTYPVPQVIAVDTLGAGDIFVGSLAHACSRGQSLETAVRFATAAASLAVSRGGGVAGMPSVQQIERLL